MNDRKKPNLEPFVWYPKEIEAYPNVRTLDTIMSLAHGVEVVLEIVEADELNDHDAEAHRVLDSQQVANLLRLAIVASRMIANECDEAFEWTRRYGIKRWHEQATGSP